MKRYDPLEALSPEEWLSLDEAERLGLVSDYHRRVKPRPPDAHAAFHVVVAYDILQDSAPGSDPNERCLAALAHLMATIWRG